MKKNKLMILAAANSIHIVKWVNALSKQMEVHLVYCKNHKPSIDVINNEVILHELFFSAPLGYYLNSIQLNLLCKKINPDVINVHYASGYGTLARISKMKNYMLSVWGSDVYDFPNQSKIKKYIFKKNVLNANYIASTSNIMAEKLKKQVNIFDKEIFITPFGVDIKKFNKLKDKVMSNKFKIGNIKTLDNSIYGIDIGIMAVKQLIDNLKENNEIELANNIEFDIYGDGIDKEKIQQLIIDNKLENCVFLRGKIPNDDVPKVLNELDVFCVTSNKESFGVAVIEAMSCSVPVVATNVDGFLEIIEDKKDGIIAKKGNIEDISKKLEVVLKNKELRNELGRNARQTVEKKYNLYDNVAYMVDIYSNITKVK